MRAVAVDIVLGAVAGEQLFGDDPTNEILVGMVETGVEHRNLDAKPRSDCCQ